MMTTELAIPALMEAMTHALDIPCAALSGSELALAGARCRFCADEDACRAWLTQHAIRGADHPPAFCRNAALFERHTSEIGGDLWGEETSA